MAFEASPPARGVLHDTASGRATQVEVRYDAARRALHLRGDGVEQAVPDALLSVQGGGWRGGAVHLVWNVEGGTANAVTIADPAGQDALAQRLPVHLGDEIRRLRGATRRGARRGRLLLALILLLVVAPFVLLGVLLLRPALYLDWAVERMPPRWDATVGRTVEEQVQGASQAWQGSAAQQAVAAIGARLLASAPAHPFEFRFHVVQDPVINAFAAPGGVVVVHTGLLQAAEDPDEVAGVLAHEISHVLLRHSMRQLLYQAGSGVILRALLGGDLPGGVGGSALELAGLGFSREQEREADRLGFELLANAGLPADGMARFFERLRDQGGRVPILLSTHPDSGDRAADVRAWARARAYTLGPPLHLDWAAVRADAAAGR